MPSIPLAKAMVLWTANRAPWLDTPNVAPPGSVAVIAGPDDAGAWSRFPSSYGSCNSDWKEGDDDYRLQQLRDLIEQLIQDDGMNPEHVLEAMRAIEGIDRLAEFTPQPRR